jgi:hypothetical protein
VSLTGRERDRRPRVEHRRIATGAATHERASVFDQAAYWLTIVGVYFLVGVLFLYSGKSKLFDDDGHAPPALRKQFEGTFIDKVPGIDTAWVIGQTSTGNTEGTASLYSYFASTAVIFLLVLKLPPAGPADWLRARPDRRG